MIIKENLKEVLISLGFTTEGGILENTLVKTFPKSGATISVDFDEEKINYPESIEADRDTTKNFSHNENFVVLECVCNLLNQGYRPEHIVLEPSTPGGREDGNYYCDILVKDNDCRPFMLIECKTTGDDKDEFAKAWKKTLNDGDQLFRYYNSYRQAQYICLYTSDFIDEKIKPDYRLIKMTDNDEQISSESGNRSYSDVTIDGGDYREYFDVWKDTYEQDYLASGVFENENSRPFEIGKVAYSVENDLRSVDSEEIKKKYNEFAVILRQHNVGSHENAFDKLVNLFLAKVVDETNNPEDLHFYWKGTAYDDDFSLQDRLQRLYRDGMKKFLGEEVTYIENSEIDKAFRWVVNDIDATKKTIKEYFRALKFFSDNDFAFISVHNERLFRQNAVVLRKIVKMIQNIRLRTNESYQNQLLGDLFEGFLNKGVKQSEGQFFTPMPIVRFIVSALPLENIIKDNPEPPYAIDYACGAGHFLTEYAFRIDGFIREYHPELQAKDYYSRIYGIEKEYRLSKVSKVSAFMYGHDDTHIIYADALGEINEVKDGTYSVLVANPPYAVSGFLETLSEKERRKYSLYNSDLNIDKNNAIETFFIERAAQLLKSGGVAGIILPVSVLTKDRIYSHAREIILKYFDIISLTKFDKNTFGKTNTSTVTMFLRRKERNTPDSEHFESRVNDWFSGISDSDYVYQDEEILKEYCNHMGYNLEDYKMFLQGNITDSIKKVEMFEAYYAAFNGTNRNAMKGVVEEAKKIRARFKSLESTRAYKIKSEDEKNRIKQEMFYSFVKAIERDKVYFFMLAFNAPCPVIIVNMPSGTNEGKKFLGYEWSNTKGNEGIKYLHVASAHNSDDDSDNSADDDTMQQIRGINGIVTPLFNPENLSDSDKINSLIRQNFLGEDFSIPEECAEYVTFGNLVDMLDFKSVAFKKEIKTNVSLKVEVKSKFPIVKLKDYCECINPSKDEIRDVPKDTMVSFIEMSSLGLGKIESMEDRSIAELSDGGYTYFRENDVLIAKISPSMENGKCGLATGLTNGLGLGSTEFHVIRGKNKYQSKFILEYLNREYIRRIASSNETGSSGHRRVPENFYSQMPIPNVPDEILKEYYMEISVLDEEYTHNNYRILQIRKGIKSIFEDAQSRATIVIKLNNPNLFSLLIGRRVLSNEIISDGDYIVYSANVFEAFGRINHSILNDFSKTSVIWGIDGDWMVSLVKSNVKFHPTDHCGVIRVLDETVILPEYLTYALAKEGERIGFSRVNRASTERVREISITIPDIEIQKKAIKKVTVLNEELATLESQQTQISSEKLEIINKYIGEKSEN